MCERLSTIPVNPYKDRHGWLLVILVFSVYAWFYNGANVNQAARYDMIFAFVEPGTPVTGTFEITPFIARIENGQVVGNTIDWSRNEEQGEACYSNKPPLPSFLGIPVYAVLYAVERSLGVDPKDPHLTYLNCYLINLAVTVFPMALSAVFAFALALALTGRRLFSFWLTLGLYFGTLAFPFSTQFWGHTLGLALTVVGAYFAFASRHKSAPIWAGFFFGFSVLCDYLCAIGVVALGIWYLACRREKMMQYVIGGTLPLIVYMAYHKACFGSFILPASSFNNPQFIDPESMGGLFNLSFFMEALKGLIISPYRGLFWYMPCLLAVFWVVPRFKELKHKDLISLGLGASFLYLLVNLFFNGWHAGNSSGPRYQIVAFIWYFIVAATSFPGTQTARATRGRTTEWVLLTLMAISVANMFVITTVSPMARELKEDVAPRERAIRSNPLAFFYKAFVKGANQLSSRGFYGMRPGEIPRHPYRYKSFTLGKFLKLPGNTQVIPPLLFLVFGIWLAHHWKGRQDESGHADQRNRSTDDGNDGDADASDKNSKSAKSNPGATVQPTNE